MRWPHASTVLAGLATAWCTAMAPVVGSVQVLSRPQSPYALAAPPGKLSLIEVEGSAAAVPLMALPVSCVVVLALIIASHRSRLRAARWAHAAMALTAAIALAGYVGFVRYLIMGGVAPGTWLLVAAAIRLTGDRGTEPRRLARDPARVRRRERQVGSAYVVGVLALAVASGQGWGMADFAAERALFGATMPLLVPCFPFVYVMLGLCWNVADQGSVWSGLLASAVFLGMFAAVAAFQAWVIVSWLRIERSRAARRSSRASSPRPGPRAGDRSGPELAREATVS